MVTLDILCDGSITWQYGQNEVGKKEIEEAWGAKRRCHFLLEGGVVTAAQLCALFKVTALQSLPEKENLAATLQILPEGVELLVYTRICLNRQVSLAKIVRGMRWGLKELLAM